MTTEPIIVEYIWISGKDTHHDIRSKCRTIVLPKGKEVSLADIPEWNFDGSSTNQALGSDTEIIIRAVALHIHPFMDESGTAGGLRAFAALCECFLPKGAGPAPGNTRYIARAIFEHKLSSNLDPWFGMEQEYILMKGDKPLGWPDSGDAKPQGPYYCSNGAGVAFGRKYSVEHYKRCLKMGLKMSGTNAEVFPGQWEYQVGPCFGVEMGDQLVLSRWVYLRVLELADDSTLDINFEVKPKKGDWNGSGLHTNFSTAQTRAAGGMSVIHQMLDNLKLSFHKDVVFYSGENNERLTGHHETSSLAEFTFGVGTRGTSVRIPNTTHDDGHGYFEDRRPGANADPYLVSSRLFASACAIPAPELDKVEPLYRRDWMPVAPLSNGHQQQ